jgi:hypothetical protein
MVRSPGGELENGHHLGFGEVPPLQLAESKISSEGRGDLIQRGLPRRNREGFRTSEAGSPAPASDGCRVGYSGEDMIRWNWLQSFSSALGLHEMPFFIENRRLI